MKPRVIPIFNRDEIFSHSVGAYDDYVSEFNEGLESVISPGDKPKPLTIDEWYDDKLDEVLDVVREALK